MATLGDLLTFTAALLFSAIAGHLTYLNWTPVDVQLFTFPARVPLALFVGATAAVAAGTCSVFFLGGYLAAREENRRLIREVTQVREERRRILELCEAVELPIPLSAVIENNVVRPGPLRLGQFMARVRAEPRSAAS